MSKVIITPSRTELGKRCYRRHVFNDVFRRGRFYSPSLEFGSVVHAGAGARWRVLEHEGLETWDAIETAIHEEWVKRFEKNPQVSQESVSEEMALGMMLQYVEDAKPAGVLPGVWKFVTIEERLELSISRILRDRFDEDDKGEFSHIYLSPQCDRTLVNEEQSRFAIVDTKTASRFDKKWASQWNTSLQMKLYKVFCEALYGKPTDVVVEGVLKKVPSEIRYALCPEWGDGILREALNEALHVGLKDATLPLVTGYDDVIEAGVRADCNFGDCFSYGYECQYMRLCTAEPEERKEILLGEYFELPEEY